MTDNELLLAISDMLSPIKTDIQDIKNDLQEVKDDVQKVKNDLQEVKDRVTRIELTQENIILPRLNTIESMMPSTPKTQSLSSSGHAPGPSALRRPGPVSPKSPSLALAQSSHSPPKLKCPR